MSTAVGQRATQLTVSRLSLSNRQARLRFGNASWPCALGRSGSRAGKREGDGATPIGRWRLEAVLFRSDRIMRPRCQLPLRALRVTDGWCDAPIDPNYNRLIQHPYARSAERLWRDDGLYDVIIVLSHNRRPRVRGLGSAIFLHVARPDYAPTEGCIALRRDHLLQLLSRVGRHGEIIVGA